MLSLVEGSVTVPSPFPFLPNRLRQIFRRARDPNGQDFESISVREGSNKKKPIRWTSSPSNSPHYFFWRGNMAPGQTIILSRRRLPQHGTRDLLIMARAGLSPISRSSEERVIEFCG